MSISESQDDALVRVRAQVMTRDDSSGGWVPLGGGGLSNVSVCKKTPDKNEYLIHGKRISDQSVVLSCTIKKDFQYNKVMPTFHHWKTGEKKFGLTFQTAADARAFDKGVCIAIEELLDGLSPSQKRKKEVGEDDVFMALDLPVERDSISSGSGSGGGGGGASTNNPQYPPPSHLHRMYYPPARTGSKEGSGTGSNTSGGGNSTTKEMMMMKEKELMLQHSMSKDRISDIIYKDEEPYSSYVQFATDYPRPHEYSYPVVHPEKKYSPTSDISNSLSGMSLSMSASSYPPKKPVPHPIHQLDPLSLQPPPLLPTKSTERTKKKRTCGKKTRCRDCHEVYSEDQNFKGSCSAGPDAVQDCIDKVACMSCARGMLYHCLSGEEGEMPPHPCAVRHHRCIRRWIALGFLSIFLPCLCLYIPLAGCHKAAKSCRVCGARHHPS